MQRRVTTELSALSQDKTYQILVEELLEDGVVMGRNTQNKKIQFEGLGETKVGDLCEVHIQKARNATMFGRQVLTH